jgi:hypothetical protein
MIWIPSKIPFKLVRQQNLHIVNFFAKICTQSISKLAGDDRSFSDSEMKWFPLNVDDISQIVNIFLIGVSCLWISPIWHIGVTDPHPSLLKTDVPSWRMWTGPTKCRRMQSTLPHELLTASTSRRTLRRTSKRGVR